MSSLKDRVCPGMGRAGFPEAQRWDGSISDLGISWCLRMIPELFVLVCVWAFIRPDFFFIMLFSEGDLPSWLSKHSTAVLQTSQTQAYNEEKAKNENISISDR